MINTILFCLALIGGMSLQVCKGNDLPAYQERVVAHPFDRVNLYNLGVAACRAGDLKQAREAFNCAKAITGPLDAAQGEQLFYNAGNVEMQLADYSEAEKSFDTVLRHNPANDKARQKRDLARQLKEQKKEEERQQEDQKKEPSEKDKKQDPQKGDEQKQSTHQQDEEQNKQQQSPQREGKNKDPQGGEKNEPQQANEQKTQKEQQAQRPVPQDQKIEEQKQAGWGGAEQQLTDAEQLLLNQVDNVDKANAKNWMQLQAQQMGRGDEQHAW